jgi:hypothetical protein
MGKVLGTEAFFTLYMPKNDAAEMLEELFRLARYRFGSAVKSRWLHKADGCPGCGRDIDAVKLSKKKKALSLNTFIFREYGVLIAYMLCGNCASYIMESSKTNPNTLTSLHAEIEKNLKHEYLRHKGH